MENEVYFYPRGRSAMACAWVLNKFCGTEILGFLDDSFFESSAAINAAATARERERERERE